MSIAISCLVPNVRRNLSYGRVASWSAEGAVSKEAHLCLHYKNSRPSALTCLAEVLDE